MATTKEEAILEMIARKETEKKAESQAEEKKQKRKRS